MSTTNDTIQRLKFIIQLDGIPLKQVARYSNVVFYEAVFQRNPRLMIVGTVSIIKTYTNEDGWKSIEVLKMFGNKGEKLASIFFDQWEATQYFNQEIKNKRW